MLFGVVWWGGLNLGNAAIAQKEADLLIGDKLIALLEQMQTNLKANDELAQKYASDEESYAITLNQKGRTVWKESAKYECAFVGGLSYIHMVEKNGKPLDAKKLASEQKRSDALNQLGSERDFVFGINGLSAQDAIHSALPICCLTTLFNNRVLGHEQINGRDNLIVESVPKANAYPASTKDKTALDWKEITWIDVVDLMPARYEVELLNDKGSLPTLLKGSKERNDFFRLDKVFDTKNHSSETVWLLSSLEGHFNLKCLWQREFETWKDTEYNYRRFKADVRLLEGSEREITDQGTNLKP
jgi:hypothetical protein